MLAWFCVVKDNQINHYRMLYGLRLTPNKVKIPYFRYDFGVKVGRCSLLCKGKSVSDFS